MSTLVQTAANPSTMAVSKSSWRWVICAALLFSFAAVVLSYVYQTTYSERQLKTNDIFYIWTDGDRIAHGVNPYSRIEDGDMRHNRKYSTYFPGFFLLVSATIVAGVDTFEEFISYWRPLEIPISLTIGLLIFLAARPTRSLALAVFGASFWIFNRWSINIVRSGQIDSFALLILVTSLLIMDRRKTMSLVLYGASLSIKQIGIFALPIYLALLWDHTKSLGDNLRASRYNLALIAIIPTILSFPFLIWDAKGFIMSVIFSATRLPGGHINGADSIDSVLGFVGLGAKLPMFALMGLVYLLVLQKKIGRYSACLLVFLTFFCFNSVLFKQYIVWFVPFVPLAIIEYVLARPTKLLHTAPQ